MHYGADPVNYMHREK